MRKFILLYILFLLNFSSCRYFDATSEKETLVKQELESINWKEVDEFPMVPDCENIDDKVMRRQCFFDFLTQAIQQKLSVDTLAVLYPELDTIEVKVTVFADSKIEFEPHFVKDSVAYDTKKIDSILHSRLVDFPAISPAIKRGIPVKSQFVLPVILQME